MKALQIVLSIIAVLLLALFIMGLMGPESYKVERSTVINAPAEAVFPHTQYFQKMIAWYPWGKMDPDMEQTFEGTDGTVGAVYMWKGNKEVGTGKQTITEVKQNELIRTNLKFIEPWEATSSTYLTLEPEGNATKTTWGIQGENNFVGRIMGLFMNMDKMMGPDLENGLTNLKQIVENEDPSATAYRGYTIKKTSFPATTYLAHRETVMFEDMKDFFSTHFTNLHTYATENKLEVTGLSSGLFYSWDEENKKSDLAVAIPVKDLKKAPAGMALLEIPANDAAMIEYSGSYEGSANAHLAMDDYIKANNLQMISPVIEEYVTGPGTEPDTSKWLTKIIYLYKQMQISDVE